MLRTCATACPPYQSQAGWIRVQSLARSGRILQTTNWEALPTTSAFPTEPMMQSRTRAVQGSYFYWPRIIRLLTFQRCLIPHGPGETMSAARAGKRCWELVGSLHSCHQSRCGTQGHNTAQTEGSQLSSASKGVFSMTGSARKMQLQSCGGSPAAIRLLRQSLSGPLSPESPSATVIRMKSHISSEASAGLPFASVRG